MIKYLVFTDLDGSLLDHHSYSWEAARPALEMLEGYSIPLIINSSKTASEVIWLKRQLKNYEPFICENGAVANIPRNYFLDSESRFRHNSEFEAHHFGKPYAEITAVLDELRDKFGFDFTGFHDMGLNRLMDETGLNKEQALAAKERQASEPILWQDSTANLSKFESLLKIKALKVIQGGRFLHVMSDVDKGRAVRWLTQQYEGLEPNTQWVTIGLGDGHNDLPMLEAVNIPVLILNPDVEQPDVSHLRRAKTTSLPGPQGWNQAVMDLIERAK